MNKSSKKRIKKTYDAKNALIVQQLAKDFSCTDSYVRLCLSGDRDNETADQIKKRYATLRTQIDKII